MHKAGKNPELNWLPWDSTVWMICSHLSLLSWPVIYPHHTSWQRLVESYSSHEFLGEQRSGPYTNHLHHLTGLWFRWLSACPRDVSSCSSEECHFGCKDGRTESPSLPWCSPSILGVCISEYGSYLFLGCSLQVQSWLLRVGGLCTLNTSPQPSCHLTGGASLEHQWRIPSMGGQTGKRKTVYGINSRHIQYIGPERKEGTDGFQN